MIAASKSYAGELGIDLPLIAINGALVHCHSTDKRIFHYPIAQSDYDAMENILINTDASVSIVLGDKAFGWNLTDFIRARLSSWIVDIQEIPHDRAPKNPTMVMVSGDEEPVRATYNLLKTISFGSIQYFMFPSIRYYPMWYLEIRSTNADKGLALSALSSLLNIDKNNVLVIGDYLNDLPMFDFAGVKATISNAHHDVSSISDYVSPFSCDNDGVADIIEKLVL
jgi:hydroxymethylpyrimidine pyrophosphatase-like HAD family hydrolase